MPFTTHSNKNYQLLDHGAGKRLEKFGDVITIRPENNANDKPKLTRAQWLEMAHIEFLEERGQKGKWVSLKDHPQGWQFDFPVKDFDIRFNLKLTAFKHVGVFPEQGCNWDFIVDQIRSIQKDEEEVRVLNLFAYTGGASIAAAKAGAKVTHVDSIKQVVNWTKENAASSGIEGIRWIVDDALKFAQKEARRGKTYHGIVMDPPSFGRGPKGERWKIEEQIDALLEATSAIAEDNFFAVINTYSGLSPEDMEMRIRRCFGKRKIDSGSLTVESKYGRLLHTGTLNRIVAH